MRAPRASGLLGAALAVVAIGAAVLAPRPLADGPRPLAPAENEPSTCEVAGGCAPAAAPGWVERIAGRLAQRIPVVGALERMRLAETIVSESERARIDPLLVLALIEVESSFDPHAASGRGARGLMQLQPSTMKSEAERSGLSVKDPHDPVTNVQAGVRYLRRLLDAFGREEVALMAYNAGPNRILGYLREGEIPERFQVYPRRVKNEVRRLRRSIGAEPAPQRNAAPSPAAPAPHAAHLRRATP